MNPSFFLFGSGFAASFFSGLLGVGGGVILVPLLTYAGPFFGYTGDIHRLTSLSLVFILFAGLSGGFAHLRSGAVNVRLLVRLGLGAALGAIGGGILQAGLPRRTILALFALAALAAGFSMLFPLRRREGQTVPPFSPFLALPVSAASGFVAAAAGVGGAGLLLPFMILFLRVPTRIAVGTSLGLVALASLCGLLARAGTGTVDPFSAVPIVLGAIPGAQLGSFISRRLPTPVLRRLFALLVIAVTARIGLTLF